jgi:hypothetical protein
LAEAQLTILMAPGGPGFAKIGSSGLSGKVFYMGVDGRFHRLSTPIYRNHGRVQQQHLPLIKMSADWHLN